MTAENPLAVGSTTAAPRVGQDLFPQPNTLVFSIDDTGDERMNNREHPVFAFGGVSCVAELHSESAGEWRTMKSKCFPQVAGPLHAKTHLRDRLSEPKRRAVLDAMTRVGRFGAALTSSTVVPLDEVIRVACGTLGARLANVAANLAAAGLWQCPGPVVSIFEHSDRLERHLEEQFPRHITVSGHVIPIDCCFMPKSVADPFLEMADFVANTIGKNVRFQMEHGRSGCTRNFQALFRDVGPPLAAYVEVTEAIFPGTKAPT